MLQWRWGSTRFDNLPQDLLVEFIQTAIQAQDAGNNS